MGNASSLVLLLCSVLCIWAGYKENVTLGTVVVCCLILAWAWSRQRFLAAFRLARQERRLESRIKHQAKEGGGLYGQKRTEEQGVRDN